MKQLTIITVVIALLLWWLPDNVALGQQAAPIPTVRHQSQCEVSDAPSLVDAYQAVLDFAPNQWTATHTHAGPVCVSQLVGDITFRFDSGLLTVPAGKAYLEDSRHAHAAGNTTTTDARMLVTNLTPRGELQANGGPAAPNPVVRTFNVKNEISNLPAQLTIMHIVFDFAPGAATPMQSHGGWALHTVLTGELTLQEKGVEKKLKRGDSWTESPGQVYAVGNSGTGGASLYVSVLLPKGATLTTDQPAAPATLPKTGDADQNPVNGWPLLAIGLLLCGLFILWKIRRVA